MDFEVFLFGNLIVIFAVTALVISIVSLVLALTNNRESVVGLKGTTTLAASASGTYYLLDASLGSQTYTLPVATANVVGTSYTFAIGNSGSGVITITPGKPYTITGWLSGIGEDIAGDAQANIVFQAGANQLNFFTITCVSSATPALTPANTLIANWIFNGRANGSQMTLIAY